MNNAHWTTTRGVRPLSHCAAVSAASGASNCAMCYTVSGMSPHCPDAYKGRYTRIPAVLLAAKEVNAHGSTVEVGTCVHPV